MNTSPQMFSESHLSMIADIGKAVQVYILNVTRYLHEEILARMDQISDLNNPQRDIDEVHCHTLDEFFRNYNYNCARGTATVYSSFTLNPEGATYATAVDNDDGTTMLKHGYCIVKLYGRHLCRSVAIWTDEYGAKKAAEPLRMR